MAGVIFLHEHLLVIRIFFRIFVLMKEVAYNSRELTQVQQISGKIHMLGVLYESCLVQNKKLAEQVQSLRQQLNEKNSELHELKTKYQTIQFSKNIELTSPDVQETKRMVNRMLRDIDQCISLIQR
jgi:uncharacterized coiled-coil DUF342 family protein